MVFKKRTSLKCQHVNNDRPESDNNEKRAVYINEDLTSRRANLLWRCRSKKKDKIKVVDCWSTDGKILIKDKHNKIVLVRSVSELDKAVA